jgi:superfamily II DNA or RNA helicase
MQCGPIRYESHNKLNHFSEQHQLIVKIKTTNFMLPPDIKQFSEIYQQLMSNAERNELIVADVMESFNRGRNPLLLTERIQHLDWFYEQLTARGYKNVFVLKGGLSKKARAEVMQKLNEDSGQRILLAIGKYIGEGFDDPKLDTLILALPISWHGTVQQYVGRLHREHQDKKLVMVYDYMHEQSQMLMRMYQKRVKKYQAMGYKIENNST